MCPPELVEELRQRRSKGLAVPHDAKLVAAAGLMPGVHGVHPNGSGGVHQEHPAGVHGMHGVHATTDRGASGAHLLTKELPKKEGEAAPKNYRLNGKDEMNAALNPDAAARKAYAQANVTIDVTGKVSIGQHFRCTLRGEGKTDAEIDAVLLAAPRYIEGNDPEKWMKTIRTGFSWSRDKGGNVRKPGIVRNGHPSL